RGGIHPCLAQESAARGEKVCGVGGIGSAWQVGGNSRQPSMKKQLIIAWCSLGAIISIVLIVNWVFFSPGISTAKFKRLRTGLTKSEVEQIIGEQGYKRKIKIKLKTEKNGVTQQ